MECVMTPWLLWESETALLPATEHFGDPPRRSSGFVPRAVVTMLQLGLLMLDEVMELEVFLQALGAASGGELEDVEREVIMLLGRALAMLVLLLGATISTAMRPRTTCRMTTSHSTLW